MSTVRMSGRWRCNSAHHVRSSDTPTPRVNESPEQTSPACAGVVSMPGRRVLRNPSAVVVNEMPLPYSSARDALYSGRQPRSVSGTACGGASGVGTSIPRTSRTSRRALAPPSRASTAATVILIAAADSCRARITRVRCGRPDTSGAGMSEGFTAIEPREPWTSREARAGAPQSGSQAIDVPARCNAPRCRAAAGRSA